MRNDRAYRATGSDPLRKRVFQRDQAIARVSRITTATAVAGTMATVGFAGLAAITYSGNLTNADSTSITSGDQSANGSSSDGQAYSQNGNSGTTRATQPPTQSTTRGGTSYNYQPPVYQPPTSTRTRSHVSTGGS